MNIRGSICALATPFTADGGLECSGNGWAKLDGQPVGSALFDVGVILGVIGLLGVVWSRPQRKGVGG